MVLAPTPGGGGAADFIDVLVVAPISAVHPASAGLTEMMPGGNNDSSGGDEVQPGWPVLASAAQRADWQNAAHADGGVVLDLISVSKLHLAKAWKAQQSGSGAAVTDATSRLAAIYCLFRRYSTLLDSTATPLPGSAFPRVAASFLAPPAGAAAGAGSDGNASAWSSWVHRSAPALSNAALAALGTTPPDSGPTEGSGFHAAAPETVFQTLSRELGVTAEVFASPLNCFYPRFCSAFADIDALFGSHGSFFDYAPNHGSFECNPPFCDEGMRMHVSCAFLFLFFSFSSSVFSLTDLINRHSHGRDCDLDRTPVCDGLGADLVHGVGAPLDRSAYPLYPGHAKGKTI